MADTKESWEIELGNAARVVELIRYEGTEFGAIVAANRHWASRAKDVDVVIVRRPGCRPVRVMSEQPGSRVMRVGRSAEPDSITVPIASADDRREQIKLDGKTATWVGRDGTWSFEVEVKNGRATAGGYRSRNEALATSDMVARVLEPLAQANAPGASQEVGTDA